MSPALQGLIHSVGGGSTESLSGGQYVIRVIRVIMELGIRAQKFKKCFKNNHTHVKASFHLSSCPPLPKWQADPWPLQQHPT